MNGAIRDSLVKEREERNMKGKEFASSNTQSFVTSTLEKGKILYNDE